MKVPGVNRLRIFIKIGQCYRRASQINRLNTQINRTRVDYMPDWLHCSLAFECPGMILSHCPSTQTRNTREIWQGNYWPEGRDHDREPGVRI